MKKKLLKTIIGIILVASLLLGMVFCKKKDNKDNSSDYTGNVVDDFTSPDVNGTLHDVTVTENSSRIFMSNGITQYKVVYGGEETVYASSFLAGHIMQASGVTLDKVSENDILPIGSNDKYIVVGSSKLFKSAGFSIDGLDLRTSGYAIKTKGNVIYIQANASAGYQLGAIAFLRYVVGYDMISSDTIVYSRSCETIPDMDIVERPDFEYRYFTNSLSNTTQIYGQGFDGDLFIFTNGKAMHNIFSVLPTKTYRDVDSSSPNYHPEWYSDSNGSEKTIQLCYTAHGDGDSRQKMLETVYAQLKNAVEKSPNKFNIPFTQEDNTACCKCDACMELERKYGSASASVLAFVNDLDDMLRADIDAGKVAGRKKGDVVHIWMFAYYATLNAPSLPAGESIEANRKYVMCNRDVGVIYAPINSIFTKTFYDDVNANSASKLEEWSKVCSNMMTWFYECNFHNYMYPYNSFDSIPDNYRFAKNNNVMIMYNQGIRQNSASTAFVRFREYLASKMQFDLTQNFNDVQKTFFDNYFRDASPIMLDLFNQTMAWTNHLEDTYAELSGGIYEPIEKLEYWPYAMLCGWMDMIDEAYKSIAKYKVDDKELYDKLVEHIKLESIFPRYVLLKLHASTYNAENLNVERIQFKLDCEQLGIITDKEGGSLTSLWTQWGIA